MPITIGTQDGPFHATDVLACAVLKTVYPQAKFIRTRDETVLAGLDILISVGGIYDPTKQRFDHRQPDRAGARENGVLYSAAGLVWKHYGHKLESNQRIRDAVDRTLFQPVDAHTNGQALASPSQRMFRGVPQSGFTFVMLISSMNPTWQELSTDEEFLLCFLQALMIAGTALNRQVVRARGTEYARDIVHRQLERRTDPRILELDAFVPWQEAVVDVPEVLSVVFPATSSGWLVQCASGIDKRAPRMRFPEAWAGRRDRDFAARCHVQDATFCHPGRFIAGAKTREGALQLARNAIAQQAQIPPAMNSQVGVAALTGAAAVHGPSAKSSASPSSS